MDAVNQGGGCESQYFSELPTKRPGNTEQRDEFSRLYIEADMRLESRRTKGGGYGPLGFR